MRCFYKRNDNVILLVADFSSFGGTRTYFKSLVKFYYDNHFKVIVALEKNKIDKDIFDYLVKHQITLITIGSPFINIRKRNNLFINLFNDLIQFVPIIIKIKPKCIVVSTGDASYRNLIIFPCSFLYILHTYPIGSMNSRESWMLGRYLGNKKQILTVSYYSKDCIVKYWLDNRKEEFVKVVYNTSEYEHNCNKHDNINTVLTLGHVEDYKNPFDWIDVARIVLDKLSDPRINFKWAGDGSMLEACRKIVNKEKNNRIRFIGFRKEVSRLYEECIVYFQPSKLESCGLSVLDSMNYSLPSVITAVGGMQELVEDGVNGYVLEMGDVEGMAAKIIQLIKNRKLNRQMGRNAFKRYNKYYSSHRWYINLLDVHNGILK
jgi:glycosyltransferase involved in cell wall biosynthesis